ncbi:MAG: hypothetical protein JJU45_16925 [Acidimicrobiia bacterium]|nr:hypothetical protein [Acidimicrobiia bacterium]
MVVGSSSHRGVGSLDPAARRVFSLYLAAQAVAGVLFWALFHGVDEIRTEIELVATVPAVTDSFLLADAAVVATSAAAAWGLHRGARWAVVAVALTTGGLLYPTLFLIAWVPAAETGLGALAVMVPPTLLTSWITWQVWRAERGELPSR